VRHERRRHFRDQILQRRVLNRRQQRLRHRTDHRVVVADFVLQERLVEFRARQAVEALHERGVALHAVVVLRRRRRNAELLRQIAALLAHDLVIAREHRAEVADLFRRAFLGAELTGLDVRRVGGVEDRHDGRVVERPRMRRSRDGGSGAGAKDEGQRGDGGHGGGGEHAFERHDEALPNRG